VKRQENRNASRWFGFGGDRPQIMAPHRFISFGCRDSAGNESVAGATGWRPGWRPQLRLGTLNRCLRQSSPFSVDNFVGNRVSMPKRPRKISQFNRLPLSEAQIKCLKSMGWYE
jgi:hypothetical protein